MESRIMSSRAYLCPALILGLLGPFGCGEMFPGQVADGVSRLTIRNLGAMLSLVSADTACGFESPAVLANPVIEGEVGGLGKVTWRVEACRIRVNDAVVSTDCNGTVTTADGEFAITAEQTIVGRITGDPENPVAPNANDAAEIWIVETSPVEFRVETAISPNVLTMHDGSLSARITPKLAASESLGVCSVVTPIAAFTEVRYQESSVSVESPSLNFTVTVAGSNLWAQNGANAGTVNTIGGSIIVYGGEREVPGDDDGLDPDYDLAIFDGGYACTEDMAWPVSFDCDLTQALGEGAARLTMQTLAGVVSAAVADTACGFDSAMVLDAPDLTGSLGERGGSVTYRLNDCPLDFPEPTVISTDCNGVDTWIQGSAVVSGTMLIEGIRSGDPQEPIVPTSEVPAAITVNATLTDLTVGTSGGDQSLTVSSGDLSGTLRPRMALDVVTGACSKQTPNAELSSVRWTDADLRLNNGSTTFDLEVSDSTLRAVNGRVGREENHLEGVMTVDGVEIMMVSLGLDPSFDPVAFGDGYLCDADLIEPTVAGECDFSMTLAAGAARLLIKNFGWVVKATDGNPGCGFSSIDGIVPAGVSGDEGDLVEAVWTIDACTIGSDEPFLIDVDCLGYATWLHGSFTVSAAKIVTGVLAIGYPPIQPQDRISARLEFFEVVFDEFAVVGYAEGSDDPAAHMVIHSATLSGVNEPVTAEAADTPGAYFVAVPIAKFENVRIVNADVTLHVDGKQFNLTIDGSDIDAFTGTYNGRSNDFDGTITVEGKDHHAPVDPRDPRLDPEFDQRAFNESYACYDNLGALVPWE